MDAVLDGELATAWTALEREFEEIRAQALASPLAADPADRVRLHLWLLQARAMVHNISVAPDWDRPSFLSNTLFEPGAYSWLMANPDFHYRYAFLNGARSYRIEGRLGASHFLEAQVISGFWGDPKIRLLENYDLTRFAADGEGRIAITVGPSAPEDGGNWIAIDPAGAPNTLILRECFNDWGRETGARLRIRPLDAPAERNDADEHDLAQRLQAAQRMVRFCHGVFGGGLTEGVLQAVGPNRFQVLDTSRDEDAANPSAAYVTMVYDVADDDALVIEFAPPKALYWSVHLGDVWLQAADFVDHQSSLNGCQVTVDADGLARIVISQRDPGYPNWLDPVGRRKGVCILRWYKSERAVAPRARLVKLADLASQMPPGSARIAAAARAEALAARRGAVLARYGK